MHVIHNYQNMIVLIQHIIVFGMVNKLKIIII